MRKFLLFCLTLLFVGQLMACAPSEMTSTPPEEKETYVKWEQNIHVSFSEEYRVRYVLYYYGENVKYGDYVKPPDVLHVYEFSIDNFSIDVTELIFPEGITPIKYDETLRQQSHISGGVNTDRCPKGEFLKGMGVAFDISYFNAIGAQVTIKFHDIELYTGTVYREQEKQNGTLELESNQE